MTIDEIKEETDQLEKEINEDDEQLEMQTYERANELSKQFEEIKDRTISDGVVQGRVTSFDTSPANGNIVVSIDIPANSIEEEFRFRKPKVWSKRYRFVRWVQSYGYDADSFPNMLKNGCKVKVSHEDGEYELVIPQTHKQRFKSIYSNAWETYFTSEEMKHYATTYLAVAYVLIFLSGILNFVIEFPAKITTWGVGSIGLIVLMFVLLIEHDFVKNV